MTAQNKSEYIKLSDRELKTKKALKNLISVHAEKEISDSSRSTDNSLLRNEKNEALMSDTAKNIDLALFAHLFDTDNKLVLLKSKSQYDKLRPAILAIVEKKFQVRKDMLFSFSYCHKDTKKGTKATLITRLRTACKAKFMRKVACDEIEYHLIESVS